MRHLPKKSREHAKRARELEFGGFVENEGARESTASGRRWRTGLIVVSSRPDLRGKTGRRCCACASSDRGERRTRREILRLAARPDSGRARRSLRMTARANQTGARFWETKRAAPTHLKEHPNESVLSEKASLREVKSTRWGATLQETPVRGATAAACAKGGTRARLWLAQEMFSP